MSPEALVKGYRVGAAERLILFRGHDAGHLVVDGGATSWMPFGEQFKQPMSVRFGQGYVPGLRFWKKRFARVSRGRTVPVLKA